MIYKKMRSEKLDIKNHNGNLIKFIRKLLTRSELCIQLIVNKTVWFDAAGVSLDADTGETRPLPVSGRRGSVTAWPDEAEVDFSRSSIPDSLKYTKAQPTA